MSPNVSSDNTQSGAVIVTGGAGFVGTPLVERLRRLGPTVVVDDLSVGRPLPPEGHNLTCHRADIRDRAAMQDIWARHRPRAVVHLAAIHHIPTCDRDPYLATEVNVMGFQSVLDACAAHGCRQVVLASSGAVYGWAEGVLSEEMPLAPCDVYSASKAANEHQLTAWSKAGRGSGAIARMFNVIGPNDPNGHLIPDLLRRIGAATTPRATLSMGNVASRRDFVDVQDMADGLAALLGRDWPEAPDVDVYNLCSGRDYQARDIATSMAAHMGVTVDIVVDPALCRAVDRPSQLGNPAKVLNRLGWRTRRDLDDSMAAIVQAWRCP